MVPNYVVSDHRGGETPGPFSNPEVKSISVVVGTKVFLGASS